jgi:hypothetical protein
VFTAIYLSLALPFVYAYYSREFRAEALQSTISMAAVAAEAAGVEVVVVRAGIYVLLPCSTIVISLLIYIVY